MASGIRPGPSSRRRRSISLEGVRAALAEDLRQGAMVDSALMPESDRMIYFAIVCLASLAIFIEMADRAPELPWHD